MVRWEEVWGGGRGGSWVGGEPTHRGGEGRGGESMGGDGVGRRGGGGRRGREKSVGELIAYELLPGKVRNIR